MSVAPYPEYKDSGVEWIGEVPAGWKTERLKAMTDVRPNGVDKHVIEGEVSVKLCNYVDVYKNDRITANLAFMEATATQAEIERFTLVAGDVLITKDSETPDDIGVAALVEHSAAGTICGYHLTLLRPRADRIGGPFLFWSMKAAGTLKQLSLRAQGITRFGLTNLAIGNVLLALPSMSEQSTIAAFLDQETGKIDALVAEQERLIALLKEKRQSVISQAVTKGLNPNAPMKDSGIEWLGQVPAHWEPRKVSHLFRAGKGKNGQMLTKEFCAANEGPYPVYSGQTEDDGVMGTWCEFEFDFSENGVLFCTTVGARAMHLKQLHGRFSLSQNCMIVWPTDSRCITRFFFYHFQPLFQWERSLIPDHMQPSFRMEDLYSFSVAVPPVDEQREIFEFLDRETNKIDTLITEATQAITLLRERRAALVTPPLIAAPPG